MTVDGLLALFEDHYLVKYSRLMPGTPIKLVNVRATAIGRRPEIDLDLFAPASNASLDKARRKSRRIWTREGWVEAQVFARLDLPAGVCIQGPAILEQDDATTFVSSTMQADIDAMGNLIITRTSS